MKRILFISGAIVGLFAIIFILQNGFLLGVPFVQEEKTSEADLNRLLGKQYSSEIVCGGQIAAQAPCNRVYVVHLFSFVICGYGLESKTPPEFTSEPDKKWIAHTARWTNFMHWSDPRPLPRSIP